jgi:hypothetical protein
MRPTLFQRAFTDDRPAFFLMALGAVVAVAWTLAQLVPTLAASRWNLLWCVALVPVAGVLGGVLGLFPGGLLMMPVLRWVERRNGAPFRVGDQVVILSRREPGRVARVYAVWAERRAVRVELDDRARDDVTDVFAYTEVCRPRPDDERPT